MAISSLDLGVVDGANVSDVPSRGGRRGRRRWPRVLTAVLGVLLAAEVGARVLEPKLPPEAAWNHVLGMAEHEENVERLKAAGGVQVLFVGSSVVAAGIEPELLADAIGAPRGAYSFWVAGPSMQGVEFFTTQLARPQLSPDVLVIAVSSRELNDEGLEQAQNLDAVRTSQAGRRLRPDDGLLGPVDRVASNLSALVRTRTELRQPGRVLDAIRGVQDGPDITPRGRDVLYRDRTFEANAEHVAQERAALRPFAVGGAQLDALDRLVRDTRALGIEVLLVDMPMVEDVYVGFHERGEADMARYDEVLDRYVAASGVEIVRARDLEWDRSLFADSNHLNGAGAARLTALVAEALR